MSAIYKTLTKDSEQSKSKSEFKNRQRVLLITSRGVTFRHRHLVSDLSQLLPHVRKEPKFDTKSQLYHLNEIAEMYNCNNVLYFEARKHQDLYMWMSKAPNGPTLKFHLQNIHTMDELNFTGNCLKGSRPILSFDNGFDETPHNQLVKEMLVHTFGVPPKARRSKPFVDHVMSFSIVDNKVWVRNFQIAEEATTNQDQTDLSLVEIGPRFVMTLITILEGSFGGPVIYENKEYVSPNFVRAQEKAQAAEQARARAEAAAARQMRKRDQVLEVDPLSQAALFK
ncbi:Ribosome biogenesis protein BRX1 [Wickerhamiella sorbophila]|uniref:Ribosome biogenesis protein BRX1 n=1 Tax=Wickerhamiella sorbophila TaxID=45607 RepID=A0A2T0FF74_9ASCO|nr:Ribosome biogenesis protein BRX1 [Wickerhamiella sorbophila]PRT53609.1 Ribosome biogenesis protein BRX1 [Wickerhamiella sorbophila]